MAPWLPLIGCTSPHHGFTKFRIETSELKRLMSEFAQLIKRLLPSVELNGGSWVEYWVLGVNRESCRGVIDSAVHALTADRFGTPKRLLMRIPVQRKTAWMYDVSRVRISTRTCVDMHIVLRSFPKPYFQSAYPLSAFYP